MNEFIKVSDIIKIWPSIIDCDIGCKLLLRSNNGPSVLKNIKKVLDTNSSTVNELININHHVRINSTIIFHLLSKRHPADSLLKDLCTQATHSVKALDYIEKNRARLRMRNFVM
jgi:hypothetical protein